MSSYRIGTCQFINLKSAVAYYKPYGFDRSDVQDKIYRGEIKIGKLTGKDVFLDKEGRYYKVIKT